MPQATGRSVSTGRVARSEIAQPTRTRGPLDLDLAHAHADQVPLLADPRQVAQLLEEERLERLALHLVAAGVDVQCDRPGRAGLVIVVTADEHRGEPTHVDLADVPFAD